MSHTFDTNLFFQALGLFYGDWNGKTINRKGFKSIFLYCYSMFWFLFVSCNMMRFLILLFWPRRTVLEYYLCDYAQIMSDSGSYRLMMFAGPLFNVWLLFNMKLFNAIHYNKKEAFWLSFLKIPTNRSSFDLKIDGYSNMNVENFWKLSNFLQNYFLKTLTVIGSITMSLICLSYLYSSKMNYYYLHPPKLFWTIAIFNYLSLLIIGTYSFMTSFGLILYLYLISKILKDRFDLIQVEFSELAYTEKNLDLELLDKLIHRFNLIIDDLQKCDVFWCKFNLLNYHFGILLCSVLLLITLYSNNIAIIGFTGIVFIFLFVPVLSISFYICGSLHSSICGSQQSLMNLVRRKEIKAKTIIRINRILAWIDSNRSGFRCGDLFPMRKRLMIEVF